MNSYENPELSYERDLTAERDRLKVINAELLAACEFAKTRWDYLHLNFPRRAWSTGDQEAYEKVEAAIAKASQ